jgi:hypothetical protein
MGFAGYVTVCVQLYCVSCHCFTQHVSAYKANFKCVGYSYFHIRVGICFAGFFSFFFCTRLHSVRFHLWGGLNMRYYFCTVVYIFFTYLCFSVLFLFVNFVVSCVCVCLLVFSLLFVCSVLISTHLKMAM